MRIFLLPVSTRRTLLHCEKITSSTTAPTLSERAITRASTTWKTWEDTPTGWKRRVTDYANVLLRRIPFEEWGLKTLPASTKTTRAAATPTRVLFPRSFLTDPSTILTRLAAERQSLHQNNLIYSVLGMPFTIPFGLIPIVPNFPFLYLLFRAYSHWKALMGARYLDFLIKTDHVRLEPCSRLDELYAAGLEHETRDATRASAAPASATVRELAERHSDNETETMVLRAWNGKLIAEEFELPEMELEIERAVEQVEASIAENQKAESDCREKRD